MWSAITGLAALLLVTTSICTAQDNNGMTSCVDNPCFNGSQCEDVQGGFICHCPVKAVGSRCQYEAGIVTTTMCLTSSNSLNNDSLCTNACDGYDDTGLDTEWVISGTDGAVGAYIVLHLVDKYNVIGMKYLQRCDPQSQFGQLLVTINDGSTALMNVTCSATSGGCSDQWDTLLFDSAKPDIYLLKLTVLETCSGSVQTDVGFRAIEVLTTIDECSQSNPCLNGGICVEQDIGYWCNCSSTGFEGDNCEQNIDDCVNVDCGNGTCVDLVNGAECTCYPGYTGAQCETNIDDCSPNPCEHGNCTDQVNGYQCTCDDGYEGTNCESDINECLSNPCVHGSCTDLVNSYNCTCIAGYEGVNCELDIDECLSNPCVHGTCTDLVNSYSCICEAGYEGTDCQTDTDDCVGVVCDNGGSCVDQVNGYTCLCADGTAKDVCTDPADLECICSLDPTTNYLDVYDLPDLELPSVDQKTLLTSYKAEEYNPCKFRVLVTTTGKSPPESVVSLTIFIGMHPLNPEKTARNYKVVYGDILERGVGLKKLYNTLSFPYSWSSDDALTVINITQQDNVTQFRSQTCPYSFDVDINNDRPTITVRTDINQGLHLVGLCGNCDNTDNGYRLRNGTDVTYLNDIQERYRVITESFQTGL